jgi:hypothetical protein
LLGTAWALLLGAILAGPFLAGSADPGDELTRYTVRLALLYYALAVALMLVRAADRLARWCWTLGWAVYVVHVALAFHCYHGWSHAEAVAHVERRSGFGPGLFFSYLFTLLWTADVAWWWLRPTGHARRPSWVGGALHGYMGFIIFNATVVYEQGFVRWAGVGMFAVLGVLLARRLSR